MSIFDKVFSGLCFICVFSVKNNLNTPIFHIFEIIINSERSVVFEYIGYT